MIAERDERRRREGRCKMCGFPPEMGGVLDERGYCLDCMSEYGRSEYRDDYKPPESEEEDDN